MLSSNLMRSDEESHVFFVNVTSRPMAYGIAQLVEAGVINVSGIEEIER